MEDYVLILVNKTKYIVQGCQTMAHRPNLTYPLFLKSFTRTRPGPFTSYCLWLLLHHKQRSWVVVRDTIWFQNQKYLLPGPLPEKVAESWHTQSCFLNSTIQGCLLSPHSAQKIHLPKLRPPLPSITWSPPGSPPALLTGLSEFFCLCLFFKCKLFSRLSHQPFFLDYNYHLNTRNY